MIQLKRAYDAPEEDDGCRLLVDRLWPRGVRKEDLQIDAWLKEIAPSDKLRKWFGHDPEKFERFAHRYRQELATKEEALQEVWSYLNKYKTITFVFAAKDRQHNNAAVLKEYLAEKSG